MNTYDVVIIGAGPGGYQTAIELGKAGVKTLLIDKAKERVGGTCLNVGCIPTKNYLESASFVSKAVHLKECGLKIEFSGLDINILREKTTELINEIRIGVLWMLEQSNVELNYASAEFIDNHRIKLDKEIIEFNKCIIATGSRARNLDILPIDSKNIISSSDIFTLKKLPKSIVIVGAGPIACEAATFFSSFGVSVTMLARSSRLLSNEDEDISKALLRVFKRNNIKVITSVNIIKSIIKDNSVELILDSNQSIISDIVLSAVGRVPYTQDIKLENTGVKTDEKGFIEVSKSFESSQNNIYAIGDCIDTPAFAHTAYAEAKIVANNIINKESNTNTHISPSTIFTTPQIASCGLNEKEAKAQKIDIEVKKAYFKANAKAKISGDDSGFAKVIISSKTGFILGASVIGTEATEIIHELLFAVENNLKTIELKKVIHAHPTVSEIITYL